MDAVKFHPVLTGAGPRLGPMVHIKTLLRLGVGPRLGPGAPRGILVQHRFSPRLGLVVQHRFNPRLGLDVLGSKQDAFVNL